MKPKHTTKCGKVKKNRNDFVRCISYYQNSFCCHCCANKKVDVCFSALRFTSVTSVSKSPECRQFIYYFFSFVWLIYYSIVLIEYHSMGIITPIDLTLTMVGKKRKVLKNISGASSYQNIQFNSFKIHRDFWHLKTIWQLYIVHWTSWSSDRFVFV